MYLFAAGGGKHNGKDHGTLCAEHQVPKLYSIKGEMREIINYNHPYKLLVDSGGHVFNKGEGGINKLGHKRNAAPPDPYKHMQYYMDCVYNLRDKNCKIFDLDIYGHLPKDTINGVYKDSISIKGKANIIRIFHPIGIDGDFSLRTLKKWVDEGQEYIAISKSSERCYDKIFAITGDQVKIHGLALTGLEVLSSYPFYSADSTNALVTPFRAGTVKLNNGKILSMRDALEQRSINYLLYSHMAGRLEQSVAMFKKHEIYITRLWEKRGIVWPE